MPIGILLSVSIVIVVSNFKREQQYFVFFFKLIIVAFVVLSQIPAVLETLFSYFFSSTWYLAEWRTLE